MAPYSSLVLACLWLGSGAGGQTLQTATAVPTASLAQHYRKLADEFEVAQQALVKARGFSRNAGGDVSTLRAEYVLRMQPLAQQGYPQAIGWIISHFESSANDPRAVGEVLAPLYSRILPSEAGAEWIWDDEIELVDALKRDAHALGGATASAYANAIFVALAPAEIERRIRALTVEAEALAPLGCADLVARDACTEVWRRELALQRTGPVAEVCERGLWRTRNIVIGEGLRGLRGVDVNENELRVDDFRGKVTVLAFFSFERSGDRARVAQLRRLQDQYDQAPFTVLGVNQDVNETLFRKLSEEAELRFPCVFEGGRHGRVASALHLDAPPKCLVLDRAGNLRFVDLDAAALEAAVAELVKEPLVEQPSEPLNVSTPRQR